MKFDSRDIALTTVFATLYAVLVLALAGISFQIVQVRIADALIPLSIVFGWPAILGVTIGCAVANIASPMSSIITDVTLGSLTNFIAGVVAWRISLLKTRVMRAQANLSSVRTRNYQCKNEPCTGRISHEVPSL